MVKISGKHILITFKLIFSILSALDFNLAIGNNTCDGII